jgi:hypothetical protein
MLVSGFLLALTFAALLVFVLGVVVAPVQAGVLVDLIEVNVSNPAAVTFTATGNHSLINDSTATGVDGVDLLAFFSDMGFGLGSVSGNLTPPTQDGIAYFTWYTDSYSSGGTSYNDLNLYSNEGHPQNFSTGAPAFTGTGTADLSAYTAFLPSLGASGNIAAGSFGQGSMAVIGQWQVTPEPATLSLLAVGGLAAIIRRKRK